jgi:dipeptidyl aminopeptidase/acylaminoacyl peptidase
MMMKPSKSILYFILSLFCLCIPGHAQETLQKGTATPMRGKVPGNYDFWIYTPADYEMSQHPTPLIIFLHGASLCGHNLDRVRRYGVLDAIERGKIVDALVLAPQNSGGAWKPEKINELLEWTEQHYLVDTTRVFVMGMSLGGYGTLDFVGTYPEKVAAAMALCGGCSLKDMSGLGKVPLWIMHGTADRAVGLSQSKRVVDFLKEHHEDSLLRYNWIKGGSHGLLARLLYLQKTYDWLTAHCLADNPRTVDRSFDIDMSDIRQTYSELQWFKGMFEDD